MFLLFVLLTLHCTLSSFIVLKLYLFTVLYYYYFITYSSVVVLHYYLFTTTNSERDDAHLSSIAGKPPSRSSLPTDEAYEN